MKKLGRYSAQIHHYALNYRYSAKSSWDPLRPPPASTLLHEMLLAEHAETEYMMRPADGGFGYYCPTFRCYQTSSFRTKCPTHGCEMTVDVDPGS